ncbi:MAG TPA: MBOAT family O-acyltransferase [Gemmataceae bacterium]|jgi:D-alanyl-lipoteichoic acid acyltransferase DltB (MBOAT superfamily)|nr:MBOAT family O-acyltransferase [Gemmataceae bacterium]
MHLDPTFWALVVGIGGWLRVAPVCGTTAFGLANIVALALLGGPAVAIAGSVVAIVLWTILWLATQEPAGIGWIARRLAYLTPVVVFFAYKAAGDWVGVRAWLSTVEPLNQVHTLLVGLSFSYTALRCVDAAHGVLGKNVPLLDPVGLAGYLFPFHMLLAGPIAAYDQHVKLDGPIEVDWAERLRKSLNDISTGLIFKHVCAEYLRIFLFGFDAPLASRGLIDTAVLFVYLFFDFAGYSRIALGVGTLMGVPTPSNFRAPFAARNITDFFSRWHMSLGGWVQRNIYVPLQLKLVRQFGVRRALWLALATLIVCWLFVGLWHRLSFRFAVYGVTFAVVVWVEKIMIDRRWLRPARAGTLKAWLRRGLGMAYVFIVVTLMLQIVMNELLKP